MKFFHRATDVKKVKPEDNVVDGDVTLASDVDSGSDDDDPRVANL